MPDKLYDLKLSQGKWILKINYEKWYEPIDELHTVWMVILFLKERAIISARAELDVKMRLHRALDMFEIHM
jgi:hypothetical protein